ncbi:hypothetical protein HanPSC8_Chr17g0776331 [Helianthus annuus]|nr:hypothetical protein HanPSC8_Chr17g0776331 [Helianthus annuus]
MNKKLNKKLLVTRNNIIYLITYIFPVFATDKTYGLSRDWKPLLTSFLYKIGGVYISYMKLEHRYLNQKFAYSYTYATTPFRLHRRC